jgi:hypothetical protein
MSEQSEWNYESVAKVDPKVSGAVNRLMDQGHYCCAALLSREFGFGIASQLRGLSYVELRKSATDSWNTKHYPDQDDPEKQVNPIDLAETILTQDVPEALASLAISLFEAMNDTGVTPGTLLEYESTISSRIKERTPAETTAVEQGKPVE